MSGCRRVLANGENRCGRIICLLGPAQTTSADRTSPDVVVRRPRCNGRQPSTNLQPGKALYRCGGGDLGSRCDGVAARWRRCKVAVAEESDRCSIAAASRGSPVCEAFKTIWSAMPASIALCTDTRPSFGFGRTNRPAMGSMKRFPAILRRGSPQQAEPQIGSLS